MNMPRLLLLLFSLVVISSCSKQEEGGRMDFLLGLNQSARSLKTQANEISFQSGSAIISKVEVEAEMTADQGHFLYYDTDQVIVSLGDIPASFNSFVLEPGAYKKISVEIELKESESGNGGLELFGTYRHTNGSLLDLVLLIKGDEFIDVEAADFGLLESSTLDALLELDPAAWFPPESISLLDGATLDGQGRIIISPDNNSNLYAMILSNLTSGNVLRINS